ncbi:MAG: malto-oligosyltrehalose synthase, partial [Candidatus Omnitrophica bacterium]|nr:malto-oligosyltrehalose synthase [Candidatus Omnitrophota bacterium]
MHIPKSTYRLQFHPGFGFKKARQMIPYLQSLGISHIYASPICKAVHGSAHGYDVVNPTELNPELGTAQDFTRLLQDASDHGLGWIQDIVPNHMAFSGQNSWLMDMFENGRGSPYVGIFDIEWRDTYQSLKGRLLAPFLGRFYSQCLEDKELQLEYRAGRLTVNYYELCFPLRLDSYADVFLFDLDKLSQALGPQSEALTVYTELFRRLDLPVTGKKSDGKQNLQADRLKLWALFQENAQIRRHMKHCLNHFNGRKGEAESFNDLDRLLLKQYFRLTFWKFGAEEINYRRFFNINQLISIRVEDNAVFEQTHQLILSWGRAGLIDGVRIDHIDGLYDPQRYLQRLRKALPAAYIVAEKILEHDESLPANWPIQGTTGYETLNIINGLFVNRKKEKAFDALYQRLTGTQYDFAELVSSKKRLIIGKHMAGDIENLAYHMKRISNKDRYGRDITLYGLKRGLVEVMANFPRYRTYIDNDTVGEDDRKVIETALDRAREQSPGLVYELAFIRDILLLNFKDYLAERDRRHWVHFVRRFQQFTGPLMAKGFEDTT